jgi:hypothetical protein
MFFVGARLRRVFSSVLVSESHKKQASLVGKYFAINVQNRNVTMSTKNPRRSN